MSCKCYHDDLNFLGKRGVCWGTKECEACSCGGDESKCDFYQCVRDRARPKMTNADKYFRNATDEDIANWINSAEPYFCHAGYEYFVGCNEDKDCLTCWLEWLRLEAQ